MNKRPPWRFIDPFFHEFRPGWPKIPCHTECSHKMSHFHWHRLMEYSFIKQAIFRGQSQYCVMVHGRYQLNSIIKQKEKKIEFTLTKIVEAEKEIYKFRQYLHFQFCQRTKQPPPHTGTIQFVLHKIQIFVKSMKYRYRYFFPRYLKVK